MSIAPEPDLTLTRSAEWFESKWRNQRVGPALHPALDYIYLARDMARNEDLGRSRGSL